MQVRRSILLALGAGLCSCALPQFDLQPRYGPLDVDGEFGLSSTSVSAKADLTEMGLEEENAFGARADFKWGLPHLVLSGQTSQHEGTGTLDAQISQGSNTIPFGANVSSSLDVGVYSGLLLFDLFPGKTFELGLGAGVALLDYDISVEDQGTGTTVQSDESLPLPVLAADVGVQLGSFELGLLASGLTFDYGGDSGTLFDGDASLRWRFLGGEDHLRASLVLGWRALLVDVDVEEQGDSVEGNADLSGPYLGLEVTL